MTNKTTEHDNEKITMVGELCRIVYKNDNNFLIGSFQGPTGIFTAIGSIINPQVNMDYSLTGEWQETAKYGEQFKFSKYHSVQPVDINGIFKYIVRSCKFVGSTVGNRLIDKYGKETLEVMKTNPERVSTDISGITLERAKEIQATLINSEENEAVMVELESMFDVPGMRKSLPGDLINIYGNNAGDVIRANPYTLTWFSGIGFALADRVALNLNYPRDGIERKKAATAHAMGEVVKEGSIWISKVDLIEKTRELIQVKLLNAGVDALIEDGSMVEDDGDVALAKLAQDEKAIAEMLAELEVVA